MDFEFHKEVEHNLWNYVFYLVYLHTLDEQSLTGFEYFVLTKFQEVSTAWIPVGSTTYLKTLDTQEESVAHLHKQLRDYHHALENRLDQRFSMIMDSIKDLKAQMLKHNREAYRGSRLAYDDTSRTDVERESKKTKLKAQTSILATDDRELQKTDSDRTTSRRRFE